MTHNKNGLQRKLIFVELLSYKLKQEIRVVCLDRTSSLLYITRMHNVRAKVLLPRRKTGLRCLGGRFKHLTCL